MLRDVSWIDAGSDNRLTAGKMLLKNQTGEIVAILNMYCYSLAMTGHELLIWDQAYRDGPAATVDFVLLDLRSLPPIADVRRTLESMHNEKTYVFHLGSPTVSLHLPTDVEPGKHPFDFPREFKVLDELLVLASLPQQPGLCIFCLFPKRNEFEVFPQDWFNNGRLDYGYQWVTRVGRDISSQKIYGEGIRISSFVLDDSNRQVEKWFSNDPFHASQVEPHN